MEVQSSDERGSMICPVCFGIEVKSEKISVKMFLFQSSWRKESIVREMTRGPFGNPALMRNDPLR